MFVKTWIRSSSRPWSVCGLAARVCMPMAIIAGILAMGCGQQNEFLAEGKDLLKSDKRRRVELAVEQFHLAVKAESERSAIPLDERAEARYLLAYYDEDIDVEGRASLFVESMELAPEKFEDRLIDEALRDRYDPIRAAVRLALAKRYATDPNRIRKALLSGLTGKDNRGRNDAAWVLGYIAADDASLRSELIEAMDHRRRETRLSAVIAIEELASRDKEAAQEAVPALLDKIRDRPKRVWWKVWRPGGQREAPEVRVLAVSALGTIGATDRLLEVLSNKGSSLRSNAMEALIESGASDRAVEVLLHLLETEPTDAKRWTSTQSLGRRIIQVQ